MEKNLKIIVESSVEKENNILLNIIKQCLERDYLFRTYFLNADVKLESRITLDKNKEDEAKEKKRNK